jgi:adenylate cyclase
MEEARREATEVLRINPKFTIDDMMRRVASYKRAEDMEHVVDGMRKAGLPE